MTSLAENNVTKNCDMAKHAQTQNTDHGVSGVSNILRTVFFTFGETSIGFLEMLSAVK